MNRNLFIAILCFSPICIQAQDWQTLTKQTIEAYNLGKYEQGLQLAKNAAIQAEKEFGRNHLNYSSSLGNIAVFLKNTGNYTEAEKIEKQNLILIDTLVGKEHLDFVNGLKNLGNTYLFEEQYENAGNCYRQANFYLGKIIFKKDKYYQDNGVYVFDASVSIGIQQAVMYKYLGKMEQAEQTYKDLIDFVKSYMGTDYEEYPNYAMLINNLGNLYQEEEQYEKAGKYFSECLILLEKLYGKDSSFYIKTQINLASIYEHTKQVAESEKLSLNILETIKKTKGVDNTSYITTLNNLSGLYFQLEKYDLSEKYCLEAKKLQEKNFGKEDKMYQTIVHNLAEIYQYTNRFNEADGLYKEAVNKTLFDVEKNFTYLTESEKRNFYRSNVLFIEEFANFALIKSGVIPFKNLPKNELSKASLGDLYDLQLATKALILNATAKMKKNIFASNDSVLIRNFQKWEKIKDQISQSYNSDKNSGVGKKAFTDSLQNISDYYEKQLNQSSVSFQKGFQNHKITWQEVQKHLKKGESAVEIVKYFNGLIYVALIITPETKSHPEIAILKSSKTQDLERQFFSFYKNNIRLQKTDTSSYNRFWKPVYDTIKAYSKNVKKIYISSDGIFNQININTLQNPKTGKYVVDETEIHLVTNTKDILTFASKKTKPFGKKRAELFGRPTYKLVNTSNNPSQINPDPLSQSLKSTVFADLEGSEAEINEIGAILSKNNWKTDISLGKNALEEKIKMTSNPDVLHIATHGFFVPSQKTSEESKVSAKSEKSDVESMLRSGIVLAGVNNTSAGQDDGILTAYEAMSLNLDETELVVLSACETGLGDILAGEGVYGLQRTLKVAGAKTIAMSLWKVNDTSTQELMNGFYKNWLKTGNKRAAFRKAQLDLKQKYPQPYFWGAFVLTGE